MILKVLLSAANSSPLKRVISGVGRVNVRRDIGGLGLRRPALPRIRDDIAARSLALSPAPQAAPPWQVLIGAFDPEHIEAELDGGAPLLLVPNNPDRAVELARQFQERPQGRLHFSRELIGAEDGEACWHRYNDPRFDGVSPPEELLPRVANLRLRDRALRRVMRLDSLIHTWANQDPALAELVGAGGGRLWVQSKLPLPIVAGLSGVLELIGEFCWTPLGSLDEEKDATAAADLNSLADRLESSCFGSAERRRVDAQAAAISVVWRQDPLRLERQRRQRLERELAARAGETRALEEERDALTEALATATSGQEAAERLARDRLAELEIQSAEGERLRAQRDDLRAQLDSRLAEAAARQADMERLERDLAARAEALAAATSDLQAPRPRRGDLRVCTDPSDPHYGSLQVLLSGPGEPELWEAAVASPLRDSPGRTQTPAPPAPVPGDRAPGAPGS